MSNKSIDTQKHIDEKIEWCEEFQEEIERFIKSLKQMQQRAINVCKIIKNWEKENGK